MGTIQRSFLSCKSVTMPLPTRYVIEVLWEVLFQGPSKLPEFKFQKSPILLGKFGKPKFDIW